MSVDPLAGLAGLGGGSSSDDSDSDDEGVRGASKRQRDDDADSGEESGSAEESSEDEDGEEAAAKRRRKRLAAASAASAAAGAADSGAGSGLASASDLFGIVGRPGYLASNAGPVFPSFSVIFNRKTPFPPCILLRNEGEKRAGVEVQTFDRAQNEAQAAATAADLVAEQTAQFRMAGEKITADR
jgi:hypothetical protein